MKKYFILLCLILTAFQAKAQDTSAQALDAQARSLKTNSIMFAPPLDQQDAQRQAYEEQMRAQEEAMRQEQERLKSLKPVDLFGNTLRIYAIVNGEILTSRDMQDRANVFVATTQIPITKQNKEMILERVLQGAIDEKIKLQEAKNNGVMISERELAESFQNFASSNGMTIDEFSKLLQTAHVNQKVFLTQMKAEMAWSKLVQRKASQNMRISQSEVKKAIAEITKDNQKQKFLISEIVIDKKKGTHIDQLVSILREDPRFELYAMQFSQSPTAKTGGHLGWVSAEQLSDNLLKKLKNMKAGEISDAVSVGKDYYIVKLEQKYTPGVDKMPVPTEAEVRSLLQSKKMEEIAGKYLRDLRNKAIVERKA